MLQRLHCTTCQIGTDRPCHLIVVLLSIHSTKFLMCHKASHCTMSKLVQTIWLLTNVLVQVSIPLTILSAPPVLAWAEEPVSQSSVVVPRTIHIYPKSPNPAQKSQLSILTNWFQCTIYQGKRIQTTNTIIIITIHKRVSAEPLESELWHKLSHQPISGAFYFVTTNYTET